MNKGMNLVIENQGRSYLGFPGAPLEWEKHTMSFYGRESSYWKLVFCCVSTVAFQWHCDILASHDYMWSKASQLLGNSGMYKHMSYKQAWLE